jgi:hypothetical protein
VRGQQVFGGPPWLEERKFDIVAEPDTRLHSEQQMLSHGPQPRDRSWSSPSRSIPKARVPFSAIPTSVPIAACPLGAIAAISSFSSPERPTGTYNIALHIASLGQRIGALSVNAWQQDAWTEVAQVTSIGSCRLIRLSTPIETPRLLFRITESPVCIALAELGVFLRA